MSADAAVDILLLLAATWTCHFLQASHFGLYEDDWYRVPLVADLSLPHLWNLLRGFFAMNVGQGRPLHDVFIYLLSYLGWHLGGLAAIYWLAYGILALNVTLLYALLRRISGHRFLALSGSLAFIVFPADTTRQFLTHAFGVQPSLTFLLAACHAYLARWRVLSYVLALGCLMSYETFFPLFLAMPLVNTKWDRRTMIGAAKHGLIMGTAILAFFLLRKLAGEPRVAGLDVEAILIQSFWAMVLGPFVSMAQYFRTPIALLLNWRQNISFELAAVAIICGATFTWRFSQEVRGIHPEDWAAYKVCQTKLLHLEVPRVFFELGKVAIIGAIMLVLAYPLALTTSPTEITGRGTRVHAAASVGAALLFGTLSAACVFTARQYGRQRAAALSLATVLALLAAVAVSVQSEYSRSWSMQRDFWTQFVRLSPSARAGTIFLADSTADIARISAFAWSTAFVLERIYRFPEAWRSPEEAQEIYRQHNSLPPPRLIMLGEGYKARYCAGDDLFAASEWMTRDLPGVVAQYGSSQPDVRFIRSAGNSLVKGESPCAGRPADPSPGPTAIKIAELPRRRMYSYLIR